MDRELLDIYDKNKQKTGKTKIRYEDDLEEGEYVFVVHAVLINSHKKMLISKRAEDKPTKPGFWEINGGCCLAGETSLQGIVREIKEELGIDLREKSGILYKEYLKSQAFHDIWLFKINIGMDELNFSDHEVEEAKWINKEEYKQLHEEGKLLHYNEFNEKDYEKCVALLFGKREK